MKQIFFWACLGIAAVAICAVTYLSTDGTRLQRLLFLGPAILVALTYLRLTWSFRPWER